MATKTEATFEGTINVCCHNVKFSYWGFDHELTPELEEELEDEAEDRAKACIVDGWHSGELNCVYHILRDESDDEEEIRGWWEIVRD